MITGELLPPNPDTVAADAYSEALLNILEDVGEERARFAQVQKGMLNILEDAEERKDSLESNQKAVLNILDDFGEEKERSGEIQKAMQNILEDFETKNELLETSQKATLNILEDFDTEKNKVNQVNKEMAEEIEERKRIEEQLRKTTLAADEANKELDAFSYSVAHDLRAPLRTIVGFGQILQEDYGHVLDEAGQDSLNRTRAAAERMAQLIDDLLQLSRVTRSEVRVSWVNLSVIVKRILAELTRQEPDRKVSTIVPEGLFCYGDDTLLDAALQNLLANAWKFTSKTEQAIIEFGKINTDEQDTFFIRDNGAGFDMAYVNKLFQAFQRLHDRNEFPGTGIGLATVLRIIRRHGGQVWAEGKPDEGAVFYFSLPGKE